MCNAGNLLLVICASNQMPWQLTKLKTWLDSENANYEQLVRFQKSTPLAEVSIVSECRRMIRGNDLLKLPCKDSNCKDSNHSRKLHVVLFTDCLLLCSIRQNTDTPVSRAMSFSKLLCGLCCWLVGRFVR